MLATPMILRVVCTNAFGYSALLRLEPPPSIVMIEPVV
jgi:hypothetical protein